MEKNLPSNSDIFEFGIINIDKPSGPTSFQVSEKVKFMLDLRKTSHFGTLDPKVTGVLPVALNRACKLTGYFIGHDKEYVGIMRMHKEIEKEKIEKMIKKKFLGRIIKLPPVKSRVKRTKREREIKSFEILEQDGKDFVFRTIVEGGTYIRKLLHDLGEELGIGAHMLELRRTRAGIFEEKESITLYELEKAIEKNKIKDFVVPGEVISKIYDVVEIKKSSVNRILHGQPLYEKDLKKKVEKETGQIVCIFSGKQFVGMFKVINANKIFAKSEFAMQKIKN